MAKSPKRFPENDNYLLSHKTPPPSAPEARWAADTTGQEANKKLPPNSMPHVSCFFTCSLCECLPVLHRLGNPGSALELHIFKVGRQMEHAASRGVFSPQAQSGASSFPCNPSSKSLLRLRNLPSGGRGHCRGITKPPLSLT